MRLATISIYEQTRNTKQLAKELKASPFSHDLTSLKLTPRRARARLDSCYSHYTHHESNKQQPWNSAVFKHLTGAFFSGQLGSRPSMEILQPRVNAGQNYPVESGFEPTPKVGRVGSFDKHEMPPRHVKDTSPSLRLHSRFSFADVSERPAPDTRLLIKLTTLPSLILITLTPKIKS